MNFIHKLKWLYRLTAAFFEKQYVLHNMQIIHGEVPIPITNREFYVFSLVRNAEEHLEEFIHYYLNLGAKKIFIVDNKSDDRTVEIAKTYDFVTVFSTPLSFARYESQIRRWFLKHYCHQAWVIAVDIDEHFDFPRKGEIEMPEFIDYLNSKGFTAVTACMLDMFAINSRQEDTQGTPFSSKYPFTDIQDIEKDSYPVSWLTRNNVVPPGIGTYKNGVRKAILKTDHEFLLVKHPLMFINKEIIPFTHPHYCAHAIIADVTCALLHYKFTDGFIARTMKIALDPKTHPHWAKENLLYADYFSKNQSCFHSDHAYQYLSVEDLAEKHLLFVSNDFFNSVKLKSDY